MAQLLVACSLSLINYFHLLPHTLLVYQLEYLLDKFRIYAQKHTLCYNYMQPIVASIAAIIMGLGVFGWEKGIAIALVFLGVYIVTKSKSKADFEKEGKEVWDSS